MISCSCRAFYHLPTFTSDVPCTHGRSQPCLRSALTAGRPATRAGNNRATLRDFSLAPSEGNHSEHAGAVPMGLLWKHKAWCQVRSPTGTTSLMQGHTTHSTMLSTTSLCCLWYLCKQTSSCTRMACLSLYSPTRFQPIAVTKMSNSGRTTENCLWSRCFLKPAVILRDSIRW